jgi:hypothetical protein
MARLGLKPENLHLEILKMERFIVQIFSHGYGSHDYHIEANTAPEAVKIAKEQAKMVYPWAQSHELSAIYQGLYVNGRGQLAIS